MSGRRASLLGLALILAATFWCYWPGLGGGYAFDDLPNILDNEELHVTSTHLDDWLAAIFSSPSSTLRRPLAMLSFALNHYFTGLDPWPMKLSNLCIHALNVLLFYGLLGALLKSVPAPAQPAPERSRARLWATAAWALHPINLMAVLFIVQRMESLSHTFVFAGLWLYAHGRQRQLAGSGGWSAVLAGLCACTFVGALAKESAVLLPLYAFCMEVFVFGFRSGADAATPARRRWLLPALYVFVLLLPALAAAAWLGHSALYGGAFNGRDFSLGERLLTEPRVLMQYLRWSLLPDLAQMSLYHDDYPVSRGAWQPPSTLPAIAGLLAVAAGAWYCRRRRPLAGLGLAWFLSAQLLTATIIPLELVFEHRNYFASAGVCLVLADLLLLLPAQRFGRFIGGLLAGFLLVFFAANTWMRAVEWDNPVRFARSEAAKHPDSPRATYELARMLVIATHYDANSPYFEPAMQAIEVAMRAPRSSILPEQAGLILAARAGRPLQQQWWQSMQRKLAQSPPPPQSIGAIATLVHCAEKHLCRFPPDEMLAVFAAALSTTINPEVVNLYGSYALNSLHDVAFALRLWTECVRLRPDEPQYRINLARLQIALGDYAGAGVQIAELRLLGTIGQQESAARELERELLAARRRARVAPAGART